MIRVEPERAPRKAAKPHEKIMGARRGQENPPEAENRQFFSDRLVKIKFKRVDD